MGCSLRGTALAGERYLNLRHLPGRGFPQAPMFLCDPSRLYRKRDSSTLLGRIGRTLRLRSLRGAGVENRKDPFTLERTRMVVGAPAQDMGGNRKDHQQG